MTVKAASGPNGSFRPASVYKNLKFYKELINLQNPPLLFHSDLELLEFYTKIRKFFIFTPRSVFRDTQNPYVFVLRKFQNLQVDPLSHVKGIEAHSETYVVKLRFREIQNNID